MPRKAPESNKKRMDRFYNACVRADERTVEHMLPQLRQERKIGPRAPPCAHAFRCYLTTHAPCQDETNWEGKTGMHLACRYGHEEIVHQLLQFNASVRLVDHYGRTCLHEASKKGKASIVQRLMDAGADASVVDSHGNTALHDVTISCASGCRDKEKMGEGTMDEGPCRHEEVVPHVPHR